MPTIGQTGNAGSSSPSSSDKVVVSKITMTENCVAESLSARIWIDSGTTLARGAIYAEEDMYDRTFVGEV